MGEDKAFRLSRSVTSIYIYMYEPLQKKRTSRRAARAGVCAAATKGARTLMGEADVFWVWYIGHRARLSFGPFFV